MWSGKTCGEKGKREKEKSLKNINISTKTNDNEIMNREKAPAQMLAIKKGYAGTLDRANSVSSVKKLRLLAHNLISLHDN